MFAKLAEVVSRKTVIAYTQCLTKFLTWCGNRGLSAVEVLATAHVRQYMLFLVEKEGTTLAASTYTIGQIEQSTRFAYEAGVCHANSAN